MPRTHLPLAFALVVGLLPLGCGPAVLGDLEGADAASDALPDEAAPAEDDAGRDGDDAGEGAPGPSAPDGGEREPDGGEPGEEADEGDAGPGPAPHTDPDAGPEAGPDTDLDPDPDPPPPPSGPLVLYMSPTGSDSASGTSAASAVRTLARVHAILVATQPNRDVHVRIAPGTYRGQKVVWTYTMPNHIIRFRTSAADNTRPVFDGCLANGSCPGGTWFTLSSSSGARTNLHFEYLRVTRYQTAISLNGSRAARSRSNSHNRLFGMYLDRIGNVFNASLAYSTAAVRLVNSDDNEIRNNHFVDVVNATRPALIHAIYGAHGSERNEISSNRFLRSTGDPVRLRDYSNGNVIKDNRFIRVGVTAAYTDWHCDHDTRTDCTSPNPECPSWDNQFRDNDLDGTWTCSTLGVWELFQNDTASGCSKPTPTSRRVRTSGNTRTNVPCTGD